MRLRRVAVAVIAAALLLHCAVPASASAQTLPSGTSAEEIGGKIEAFVEAHGDTTAGMAVSVFGPEQESYTGCFGCIDLENDVRTDEDAVFEWGSATKLLVWVSVMQLQEQGKLDLDADIRTMLPEGYLKNLRFDAPVTLRNLMNHNAGFQECPYKVSCRSEAELEPLGELLSRNQPSQVFAPGERVAYSNWGVALAGYLVERVSGQEFYAYVNEHIFAPLEMRHASVKPDYRDNGFVRSRWEQLRFYSTACEPLSNARYFIAMYPAGSCVSTIGDFTRFGQALLSPDSPLFSDPATYETFFSPTMTYPGTEIPRNCHGMWMEPFGVMTFGHGGNTAGCSSYLLVDPVNHVGVCVMTNQYGESVYNVEMMELVFGRFDAAAWGLTNQTLPEGFFRTTRTVFWGPLKLYSLLGISRAEGEGDETFFLYDPAEGIYRVPYGDAFQIPTALVIFEWAMAGLWGVSSLTGGVLLIIALIKKLKRSSKQIGRLPLLLSALQFSAAPLLAYLIVSAISFSAPAAFRWCYWVFCAILIALVAVWVALLLQQLRRKEPAAKGCRILALCTGAVSIANLLYWNLFMFWVS